MLPLIARSRSLTLDTSTAQNQYFSLPLDQMRCIRDNASPEVLDKLYQCCKWFPIRRPAGICSNLLIESCFGDNVEDIKMDGDTLRINAKSEKDFSGLKLFIKENIKIRISPCNYLSKIISTIQSCTLKSVEIYNQELRWNDIKLLIQHGSVKKLALTVPPVSSERGEIVPDFWVENLLALTPNITKIHLDGIQCTTETFLKLAQMNFNNKFQKFHLGGIASTVIDPDQFASFLNNQCTLKADISWSFRMSNPDDITNHYINRLGKVFLRARIDTLANSGEFN